jgi:hypothetical protein
MNLEQLRKVENLSLRSYNVCKVSKLRSLDLIVDWYKKYGKFKNIRNCGNNSNRELISICIKHIEQAIISDVTINKMGVNLSSVLSVRAFNVCVYNELSTIESLIGYYKSNGSFDKFRNCGQKTNQELTTICIKYIDQENTSCSTVNKVHLNLANSLSVRAYNVCVYNELSTVESLISYYKLNGTFDKFRNCGLRTNVELIRFCDGQIELEESNNQIEQFVQDSIVVEDFNLIQREIIDRYVKLKFTNLPSKINSALLSFFSGEISSFNLFNSFKLNDSSFNLNEFDFLDNKSMNKLAILIKSFKDFVKVVYNTKDNDEIIKLNFNVVIKSCFSEFYSFEKLRKYSIFCVVQSVLVNDLVFKNNVSLIFTNKFNIYNNDSYLLINKKINLTKERIRQICKVIFEELFLKISFVKNLVDESLGEFDIFQSKNIIYIDELLNEKINSTNHTDFTVEWNSYLIYVYYSDTHELVGRIDDVLYRKNHISSGRHNWKSFYVVNREILKSIDLILFLNEFNLLLLEKRSSNISLNIEDYVVNKFRFVYSGDLLKLTQIIMFILRNEFELDIDYYGHLALKKNTSKPFHECVYTALSTIGTQASVSEINSMVSELFPEEVTTEKKIRAVLKRKFGFVPVGRSSIFGLAHWENELSYFKGGTIRSLVSDYLKIQGSPRHIDDISDFVKEYRPNTYDRSVWQNLRTDTSGIFVFSNDGFVGLKSNITDEFYERFNDYIPEKVKTWEQSFSDLVDFVNEYKKLPRSYGCPLAEIQIYRWCSIQIRKMDRGDLELIKSNQLKNLVDEFRIRGPLKRFSILQEIENYESIIFDVLSECPGQIASKEFLYAELVKISKLDGQLVNKILNKAPFLKRRLCLTGRPFFYYHTTSDILDISRDYDNVQDFIVANLEKANNRLEYYYKLMQKMIAVPNPGIITGAISRLMYLKEVSQFYHKFIDNDSEILMSNRTRVILDNLIMGLCESMANHSDISFFMDLEVYNNKFVKDFVSYLVICGVVRLNVNELKIEIVYLINYNDDKVLLENNIEALFLPFVLKDYFIANKFECEFMVLGFSVKYNNRFNLISYE